jgi:NTP pyrophosphatase (non-canonical NTP hydrolase)
MSQNLSFTTLKQLINKIKNFGNSELIYWSNAIAGESGELCNLVKKLYRDYSREFQRIPPLGILDSYDELYLQMCEEIADIFIYIAITARDILKIDLEKEVLKKLEKIEERRNEFEEDFDDE